MAKKTPAAPENAQDSAQKQPEAKIAPQAESASEAGSTLPFAQKRDELIKKFRANAVPREADYKQLLDQHYDVAGALGMANKDDNNGGKTGNGLVFDSTSGKLQVKANATGGLVSDANGVSLAAGKSLEIGADNKVNVKISNSNGLIKLTNGEVGVNLRSNNIDSEDVSAAVIINNTRGTSGLWINVGIAGDKKGLKQYRSISTDGAVLGVSHDGSLKIDSTTGKLGVSANSQGGLVANAAGLMINTIGMSGLKIENNVLKLSTGPSLEIGSDNKVNVKISGSNGLTTLTNGEVGVKLLSKNMNSDDGNAAVITNVPTATDGLGVNVGYMGNKKGLKQYQDTESVFAVLGVSHDNTLKIDSTGKLGINTVQFQVRSVSWPLSATAGDVKLHTDSSLAVNSSGQLGFSKDRTEAIRLYGRVLNAQCFAYDDLFVLYTYRSYFIFIVSLYYQDLFDTISSPERYKTFTVKNVTNNTIQSINYIYGGGIYSGMMPKEFSYGDEVSFTIAGTYNFKLRSI
ncbi:hypothetical protein [Pantoea sp. A4]|uniref:hypothetical protein n=1 Tax=Pantoea sp. A4 TaxID=1225184 RepID=UPI00037A50A8|nr:hypothetical protein [Pantoea sp. A4]